MKKRSSIKASLLSALLCCLLTVAAFVGTTFAYFTASLTTGVNRIISGNLDVAMNYWNADDGEFQDATDAVLLDPEALWEPGYVSIAYLEIENLGSLSFNYLFAVYPAEEVEGYRKDGSSFYLSDYLVYAIIEYDVEKDGEIADRDTAMRLIENRNMGLTEEQLRYGTMHPDTEAIRLAMIVYMPTYVTSEQANHDKNSGQPAPSVRLAVDLYATQNTYESDSFNHLYDAGVTPVWAKPIWRFAPEGYVVDSVNKKITVNTVEALKYIGQIYDDMVAHPYYRPEEWEIVLGNDMDFGGEVLTEPIHFGGFKSFDGNDKTITNVILNYIYVDEYFESVGLFDELPSTKDLTLQNVTVNSETTAAGVLAGKLIGDSYSGITISDSSVTGVGYIGGMIGWGNFLLPIDFSGIQIFRTDLSLFGDNPGSAGGFAGYAGGSSVNVSNSTVSGLDTSGVDVAGSYVGGMFGEIDTDVTISLGTVTEITIYKDVYIGSITGRIYDEKTVRVTESTVAVQASTGSDYRVINLTSDGEVEESDISVDALGFPKSALHTTYNGHYYQVLQQRVNWQVAYENCAMMYGHLATITSAEENEALRKIVTNHGGSTWLGGCRESVIKEGGNFYTWVWITGEEMSYTHWDGGEPNNYQNLPETCMHMYASSGLWNDYHYASSSATAYVCEWDSLQSYLNYLTAQNP